jgi:hypothetical protein
MSDKTKNATESLLLPAEPATATRTSSQCSSGVEMMTNSPPSTREGATRRTAPPPLDPPQGADGTTQQDETDDDDDDNNDECVIEHHAAGFAISGSPSTCGAATSYTRRRLRDVDDSTDDDDDDEDQRRQQQLAVPPPPQPAKRKPSVAVALPPSARGSRRLIGDPVLAESHGAADRTPRRAKGGIRGEIAIRRRAAKTMSSIVTMATVVTLRSTTVVVASHCAPSAGARRTGFFPCGLSQVAWTLECWGCFTFPCSCGLRLSLKFSATSQWCEESETTLDHALR